MAPNEVLSNKYWQEEFQVTKEDLDRIALFIEETQKAYNLTYLAKRLILKRLRFGKVSGEFIRVSRKGEHEGLARIWNPAEKWRIGDLAIVASQPDQLITQYKNECDEVSVEHEIHIGEVIKVEKDTISIRWDRSGGLPCIKKYAIGLSQEKANKIVLYTQQLAEEKLKSRMLEDNAEAIMAQNPHIAGDLNDALKADRRFIQLDSRWFLGELCRGVSKTDLESISWYLFSGEEPKSTEALCRINPSLASVKDGDLFSLYIELMGHPETFQLVEDRSPVCWVLYGSPLGKHKLRFAAYDPGTYQVLCLPDRPASEENIKRLFSLGLLKVLA